MDNTTIVHLVHRVNSKKPKECIYCTKTAGDILNEGQRFSHTIGGYYSRLEGGRKAKPCCTVSNRLFSGREECEYQFTL